MNNIFNLNRGALFSLSMALVFAGCNGEEKFGELESQKVISEINLKVSDPLPLLINTDSLIAYEVLPEDASNKNLIWTSSDEEIANVDAEGRIYANTYGSVFITAAPEVGFAGMKTIEVQVIDKINVITEINVTNTDLSVYATAKLQLETSYKPVNATYSSLSWKSLNTDIATVDDNGVVTGVAPGEATIVVSARDGGKCSKEIKITVKEVVPISEIHFNEGQSDLAMYETGKFKFTTVPADATTSTVRWYSDATNVVSINEETGLYYVKSYGTATITVKSGDVVQTLAVTVQPGKINDDFSYGATNWRGFSSDYSTAVIKDGKFVVTPGTNSKASIERIYDTDFHAGNYPILAIKRTEPATTYSMVLDMWTNKDYGAYRGEMKKIENPDGDGANVYYADLTSQFGSMYLSKTSTTTLDVFVYRMNNLGSTENISYEVYWVKTFKSEDELKTYLGISNSKE